MTRNRVLFRADASHAIGFGHVARTAALIEEVAARGDEPVALFGGDDSLRSWARDRGIPAEVKDWSPTDLLHATEDPRVRAVVIDGPQLAVDLLPKLADRDVPTVLLDDNGQSPFSVTTVVNHNVHAPALSYPAASRRLLGRRYLLLRRDIRRYMRGSCRPSHGAAHLRVVITFGGSDPAGATARTLCLLPPDRPLEVVVIAGPGYRDEDALQAAAALARDAGHTVDIRRAPDDPGALFVSADAAITSAGGTLGELAYLGCPALAFAIVPDQIAPARAQVRGALIASGRTWADADDDAIRGDLSSFLMDDAERAELRQRALATADADGPRRVVDEALG
jgi:spore coat polysaccharide biosynthesis predicted glycosyltransferase SpsG